MDLETASTDELIDELQKRFDHSIFGGVKELNGSTDETDVRYSGDMLKCAGLMQLGTHRLMRDFGRVRR